MRIGTTEIEDTFAEAFSMRFTRLIVTAHDDYWLRAAVAEFTGDSSSVIGCDAECGVDQWLPPEESPDGRPGAVLLAFGFSIERLAEVVPRRTGQSLMTCPTTAVYDGLPEAETRLPLGKHIRYFGDGYQKSKLIGGHRFWRIPVMDGEFVVQESCGANKGVAGGNLILQSTEAAHGLAAARRAGDAVGAAAGVIAPFPGGVVRSGSKVGSRYKKLVASTAHAFCPSLRGRVETRLHAAAQCAYEIVIDGIDESSVRTAMRRAMHAAADGSGVVAISAGNYGGKLGKYHLALHEIAGS